MNEQQYSNQSLNEYLLGSLSDAEAERFDELSFTDDDFNDALKIAEKDLVDAYVHRELSGATLENFNSHYLASPLRREKVEFAKALQVYAKRNGAEIPAAVETKPERNFFKSLSSFLIVPRPGVQWSFALAALALVFFGGWLWRENLRLRDEMSQANANRERLLQREAELAGREKQLQDAATAERSANSTTADELAQVREERAQLERQLKKQTQEEQQQRLTERRKLLEEQQRAAQKTPVSPIGGIAAFVLAPSLRGGSRIQTVSIPPRSAGIAAALELETDEYAAYRAVLRDSSGSRVLWQSGKLKSKSVGGNTRLNVNFPAALLKSDVYSIELTGIAADGAEEIIGDYSFRVVR